MVQKQNKTFDDRNNPTDEIRFSRRKNKYIKTHTHHGKMGKSINLPRFDRNLEV